MTLEHGLIKTCLFPHFSALLMLLRASLKTLIRTILYPAGRKKIRELGERLNYGDIFWQTCRYADVVTNRSKKFNAKCN